MYGRLPANSSPSTWWQVMKTLLLGKFQFIFVFGVINVQKADQVMAWAAWFSVLSFLVVMTKISKLR